MTAPSAQVVKSARRVLEIIEFFDAGRPWATVTDISRELAYPQSSTSVLLKCLRDLGYLYYNRINRAYRLTARAALLGCTAEGGNYRGGRVPDLLDAVAERVGETVVLFSNNVDYASHYIHVIRGSGPDAVPASTRHCQSIMTSIQGQLVLSTYPDEQLRLALRRLNADEPDLERKFNLAEKFEELRTMRHRGFVVDLGEADRHGVIAMLLPRKRGSDRLGVSVLASADVLANRHEEILSILLEERSRVFDSCREKCNTDKVVALRTMPHRPYVHGGAAGL